MTESGSASSRLGPSPTHVHHNRRRRRRRYLACLICLVVLLILVITAVILALTLFKPRDPQTTLVSATLTGISPRVTLPAVRIDLNVTLDLDLLVRNPNYASFAHEPGKSQLLYRGDQIGESDVAGGRIPSRGSEHMRARMTVEVGKLAGEIGKLIQDVLAGQVEFDTNTRIPGKVIFLGFIKRHAVATSKCHVDVSVQDLKVTSQQCDEKTKL